MLAGCSSTLLSPRHRLRIADSPLPFHHQHQQDMGTHRFDLPHSFTRKESPRISISLDKPVEARGSCSFRQNPLSPTSSSSSLIAQTAPPMEPISEKKPTKSLKRTSPDEFMSGHNKRVRGSSSSSSNYNLQTNLVSGMEFPQTIETEVFTSLPITSIAFGTEIQSDNRGSRVPTNSNSSSDDNHTHCNSSQNQNDDTSETETGNGSHHPVDLFEPSVLEHQGFELLNLLVACVDSVSSRNLVATNYLVTKLGEHASPDGSPIHRLVSYYTEALVLRVAKLWPQSFCVAPPRDITDRGSEDDALALRVLNHVTPVVKFMHFTMNEMMLRAFEGKDRVHVIDFDIKQGLQWPVLFQSLASRANPPSHVRITGIGDSKQDLHDTGIRLATLAEALRLPFEFHAVIDRLEDVRFWMLHVKEGECIAVNCPLQLHKALYDENLGVLTDFLGLIRSTNPAIVVTAEQEAEHNDRRWETRIAASLPHYAAIFDTMDTALPTDSPARARVERMFGREIRNVVACEGSERTERHEGFGTWRRAMERGGLRCIGVREREVLMGRMLLRMFPSGDKYSLIEQCGSDGHSAGITLRWMDQPLYTVSAWTPADVAGNSMTSTSQRSNRLEG